MTPQELRRHLGEIAILIFYAIVDIFEIWPRSHFWAILSGVFVFGLFTIVEIWNKIGITLTSFYIIFAIIAYWIIGPIPEPSPVPPPPPWRGWLQAGNEPTPQNACDRLPTPPDTMKVLLSDSVYFGTQKFLDTHQGKFVSFSMCGIPALSVESGVNGMRIDTTIHDKSGKLLGELVDNGYRIDNEPQYIIEHSADLSTLVVHSVAGDELLYVHRMNATTVRVRGIFACESGKPPVAITDHSVALVDSSVVWNQHYNCFGDNDPSGISFQLSPR